MVSAWIKHRLAAWSSTNDKSPFHLLAGEDFKFWMKCCTQTTTRMTFVKVHHRSRENTGGTGLLDTNLILTQHVTERNDQHVTQTGDPSPKGLWPGIQDHAAICPNSPFHQPKLLWWPDLSGSLPVDSETISPSKSSLGFYWCNWKWKFSIEKEHS